MGSVFYVEKGIDNREGRKGNYKARKGTPERKIEGTAMSQFNV